MAISPFGRIADSLRDTSSTLKERATALSDAIEQVESFLIQLPGKVSASIEAENFVLSFDKSAKGWALYVEPPDSKRCYLRSSSLGVKIEAADLLPELIKRLDEAERVRLREIDEAASTLERVVRALGEEVVK